ncbi:hypothetical protein Pla175_13250 [Pirellulimonas nuda]|uniref:Uncharacterized protein n=1 Tax=Pirellulimonas nuda TaxID=2528009 RepID=A0A518D907_9BACT|nr:hypothetical protein [Pirellulimonas nuda]QDU87958.1 hypothetical protein Pla175_13250 [Pirellulimonas nuda]
MEALHLVVGPQGTITTLYDETLDLATLGRVSINRASHVEPDPLGHWLADLSPVDGPLLGPFAHRSEALRAERDGLLRSRL